MCAFCPFFGRTDSLVTSTQSMPSLPMRLYCGISACAAVVTTSPGGRTKEASRLERALSSHHGHGSDYRPGACSPCFIMHGCLHSPILFGHMIAVSATLVLSSTLFTYPGQKVDPQPAKKKTWWLAVAERSLGLMMLCSLHGAQTGLGDISPVDIIWSLG